MYMTRMVHDTFARSDVLRTSFAQSLNSIVQIVAGLSRLLMISRASHDRLISQRAAVQKPIEAYSFNSKLTNVYLTTSNRAFHCKL